MRELRQFEISFPYLTKKSKVVTALSYYAAVKKAAEELGLIGKYNMSSLYQAASYTILDNKRRKKKLYDV